MNPKFRADMNARNINIWEWRQLEVAWTSIGEFDMSISKPAIVLIHGFGACKEHWRNNQPVLGKNTICYAIDLIGFGDSSQPKARLKGDKIESGDFEYGFNSWAEQITDFCNEVIKRPVILIGNSIGGVIALRACQMLKENCHKLILIDCAQRQMDDKRLKEQPLVMTYFRPILKMLVRQRWLSKSLFRNASNRQIIKKVLMQAYPSGKNITEELIDILREPSQREGASEAFRGFINLFDDYLAPELMQEIQTPVNLIWGENDPWEPLEEAQRWLAKYACIHSLEIISNAGHCPHDEDPEKVNQVLLRLIQATI